MIIVLAEYQLTVMSLASSVDYTGNRGRILQSGPHSGATVRGLRACRSSAGGGGPSPDSAGVCESWASGRERAYAARPLRLPAGAHGGDECRGSVGVHVRAGRVDVRVRDAR